jgi:hypothetical protein
MAVIGIAGGFVLSRAAFAVSDVDKKQVRIMIGVWALLLAIFSIAPWFGFFVGGKFSWRLFGVYRWTDIIAIFGSTTCLLFAIWKRIEFERDKS